ncbi:MAG: hypothetical protein D4R83_02740, partial [Streptomycetaceae bacterium]
VNDIEVISGDLHERAGSSHFSSIGDRDPRGPKQRLAEVYAQERPYPQILACRTYLLALYLGLFWAQIRGVRDSASPSAPLAGRV